MLRIRAATTRGVVLLLLAAALVVKLHPFSAHGGADNILVNPGFEDGVNGWERLDGTLVPSSNARSGSGAARMVTATTSQRAISVQEGLAFPGEWEASIFVFSGAAGVNGDISLEFIDANGNRVAVETASTDFPTVGYHELALALTAPSGTIAYRLVLQIGGAANAAADFDDAFLGGVAAPEPTATVTPTPPESPTPTPTPGSGDDDDEAERELAASLYLRNPTFEIEEDGLSRHWKVEGGQLAYTTTLVRSGIAAGHATGNLSTPITVSQTVRLLNENTRRFAVYALASPPGGSVQLTIQWLLLRDQTLGEPVESQPMQLDGIGYQEIALVAKPPARASGAILTITVINGAMGANVRLDDASWRTSRPAATESGADDDNEGPVPGDGGPEPGNLQRPGDLLALPRSDNQLLISEVYYAAETGEAEWVELRNVGDDSVILRGWTLFDNKSGAPLDNALLVPGGYMLVASEGLLPSGVDSAYITPGGSLGNGLANDGDQLILLDSEGALVDAVSWGDDAGVFPADRPSAGSGRSITRLAGRPDTDTAADFSAASPTPLRGLASFELDQREESDDEDVEEDDDEAAAGHGSESGGDGSEGIDGWLLMLIVVAVVLLVGGASAWFRREEIGTELARLRSRWWRF